MIVSITGATGFIGQKLVLRHLALGDEVRVFSRRSYDNALFPVGLKWFQGDLSGQDSLDGFLDGADILYHCAGEVKNIDLMHTVHVDGTVRLLEEVSKKVKITNRPMHWIQLSSVGAYGPPSGAPDEMRVVTENTPHAPVGTYEVTKTISDELVMKFAENEPLFSYTILRPSNVIGPSMPNQSLRSLVRMIKKRLFFYIGSRSAVATYIHVDDVVDALVQCGEDLRARGKVFNLSNDCMLSDMVNAVAEASGFKQLNICMPEKPLRYLLKLVTCIIKTPLTQDRIDALVRHTYYPSDRIGGLLEFVPKYDIPSAVSNMFEDK